MIFSLESCNRKVRFLATISSWVDVQSIDIQNDDEVEIPGRSK